MLLLHKLFPTIFGSIDCPFHADIRDSLISYCISLPDSIESGGKEWVSNKTYNTSDERLNILHNKNFEQLNNWIIFQVQEYGRQLLFDGELVPITGWVNIYRQYDYQEYHVHKNCTISVIYFMNGEKDYAKVCFRKPGDQMYQVDYIQETVDTYKRLMLTPHPGRLIIFPSDILHCVERHEINSPRITLSYNFVQKSGVRSP